MNSITDKIVSQIDSLTPISQVMHKLLTVAEDPKSSMSDIAEVIVYDPAITAGLIRTCNSAYFALPRRVDSVQDAIILLGLDQVIDLVMINSVSGHLRKEQKGYGLHQGDLWQYSVATAIMAKNLADRKGASNKHLVFTASLLKDIGKLVLDRFVADAVKQIIELVQGREYSFREAEKKVIGLDHAELGGMIAKKWNFSPKMTFIIENHHMTDLSALEDMETSLVYLSEIAAMMIGVGSGADGLAYKFHKSVLDQLEVSENELQEIIALSCKSFHDVKEMLSVA